MRLKLITASCMDTSIFCPWPVFSRCQRAAMTPKAAWIPAPVSPMVEPGLVGGPSGKPVKAMEPPAAWAIISKLLYLEYGP